MYLEVINDREHTVTAEVVLVVAQAGETDLMSSDCAFGSDKQSLLRSQIMALRYTPFLAFRPWRDTRRIYSIQDLSNAWQYSYEAVESSVALPIFQDGLLHFKIINHRCEVKFDFQRSLLRCFSPHLSKICRDVMDTYYPVGGSSEHCDSDRISQELSEAKRQRGFVELGDRTLMLIAIVLGTMYGLISKSCFDERGKPMDLDSDVAFSPDLLLEPGKVLQWAETCGAFLNGRSSQRVWTKLVIEMTLGMPLITKQT